MSHAQPLAVTERFPAADRADAPLVVLVHGSLDRAGSFARVQRRLGDLHTLSYDRRGYQGSRNVLPVCTSIDEHVDDLLEVIDGRVSVVVGHSYGGDIAVGAALRGGASSGIVAVLAYEPPMPWLGRWARSAASQARLRQRDAAAAPYDADPAVEAEGFFRRMVGDDAWERLSETAKQERRADGPALVAELAAVRTSEPPFDVTGLAVPATFGRGERSATRHRDTVAWLVDHVPGSVLVEIGGAGHGAHLTHPDAFAAMVRGSLSRAGFAVGTAAIR
jgi:pimeloyl-ACP methyl ester carboxylesterase